MVFTNKYNTDIILPLTYAAFYDSPTYNSA